MGRSLNACSLYGTALPLAEKTVPRFTHALCVSDNGRHERPDSAFATMDAHLLQTVLLRNSRCSSVFDVRLHYPTHATQ